MTRRLLDASDDQLGAAIAGLDLQWPEAPAELGAEVVAGIREASRRPRTPRPAMPHRRKVVLLIAAAILMLAAAATAAKLVIDLGAVTIEPFPTGGPPLPTETTIPDLGEPVTLAEAEAITGTEPNVPAALGEPDRVWVDAPEDVPDGASEARIVMAWLADDELPAIPGSRYGAVLIRWDAHVDYGTKLVSDRGVRTTTVPGWPLAYWVSGEHELILYGDDGPTRLLVRGHVLLWGDESTTFRLETRLPRRAAVDIAATT